MPSSFRPSAHSGTLHHYTSRLVAFEHDIQTTPKNNTSSDTTCSSSSSSSSNNNNNRNILLWVGGLGDGLLTVPYVRYLAQNLPSGWVLVEVLLSSSYNGWGTSSLKKDVRELERCVGYLRDAVLGRAGGGGDGEGDGNGNGNRDGGLGKRRTGKIVLMGHSTGCQDVMEYLIGGKRGEQEHEQEQEQEKKKKKEDGDGVASSMASQRQASGVIHGAILQAPVSDREGLVRDLAPAVYASSVRMAEEWVAQGRGGDVLPVSATGGYYGAGTPISANRWLSLASPGKDGDDDYFSSDLSDGQLQRTFGRLPRAGTDGDDVGNAGGCPVLILYSGKDEHVPEFVDKEALVKRWVGIMKANGVVVDEENGGILPGAHHSFKLDSEEVMEDLVGRVQRFLENIDNGSWKK